MSQPITPTATPSPFMSFVYDNIAPLKRMRYKQILFQIISFGLIISSALMIWKSLMLFTGSECPIVVVLSGSMEPAFHRGDLLFLYMSDAPFQVGEIVVFKIVDREIPIVHRIIKVHERSHNSTLGLPETEILTKGDNNQVDDRGLYQRGQLWLKREHILGRAMGFLPYVGMVTIIMNDFPIVKYLLIAFLGFFVLVSREQ
eukprot:TRINITY_DN17502_c0_g1_i1.p1 TRINITY_DN17502_c0_g1~~TRINITY_DN17502_c0_g1_i1.p1  ORF type:complete len:201 (-),score=15.04 TRINITY_DN17502_c0_g1_i1:16-618(-)